MVKTKKKYPLLDRDLSWMYFNQRLLQEAGRDNVPLLERFKFLGLYSNNLNEFFRVRVSTLYRIIERMPLTNPGQIETAAKALKRIHTLSKQYEAEFDERWAQLIELLQQDNIFLIDETRLTEEQAAYIRNVYRNDLSTSSYPLIITQGAKLNELTDAGIYLAVRLTGTRENMKEPQIDYAMIELPVRKFGRFITLPSGVGETNIIFLDDVIRYCLPDIFAGLGYETFEAYTLKFTRDAEIDMDKYVDLQEALPEKVIRAVHRRKKGELVRYVYDRDMPHDMLRYIKKKLNVNLPSSGGVAGGRYHNMKDLMDFPVDRSDLRFISFEPIVPKPFQYFSSILDRARAKDLYLHYPYHSFSNYLRILREAALSPEVNSIKITIYRLAKNSQVVETLIYASKHGKEVTAVVELMARFDEESNIHWAEKMQEAGINVIFGVEGLKVHCKLTHISSSKGNIACISTGNFHEENAKLYTDMTLITGNDEIAREVDRLFAYIHNPSENISFEKLIVSPENMRRKLNELIDREICHAQAGEEAYIYCKINHITDEKIIQKLYEASQAGVRMRFLVRGNCSVITEKKVSENIQIRGIIDRFLEHSRLFIFCNGGDEQYFLGSADWMIRNLDHRIEVYVPVYDPIIQQGIKRIILYGLEDNLSARVVDGTGENRIHQNNEPPFRSQQELLAYYASHTEE